MANDRETCIEILENNAGNRGEYTLIPSKTAKRACELLKEQNGLAKALEQMTATNDYLNKEVERLEAEQPKWIPFSEQLPEVCETVLFTDGFNVDYGYINDAAKFVSVDDCIIWNNDGGYSHWMPLPEPPKKDGEKE